MGFALRTEAFKMPIPREGGVMPTWYSNAQALHGELPQDLLAFLPQPVTLRMDLVISSNLYGRLRRS
jgi:hypothetical protein